MYIAVDIGGTKTLVAAYSEQGELLRSEKNPTNPDYHYFSKELIKTITSVIGDDFVEAICVAAPGKIDYSSKRVLAFGNLGWTDVDIQHRLHKHFDVPTYIDNDGNLGALGEAHLGAGQGYDSVLYVTVSTGIGTGITYKGVVPVELAASEGGSMHFRHDGQLMKWESFASGKAFVRRFGQMGKDVSDPAVWKEFAEDLSLGFGSLMAVIEPDVIIVGGSMGEHLEKFHSPLVHALQRTRANVVKMPIIVEAKFPNEAVINGCYVLCKQQTQN